MYRLGNFWEMYERNKYISIQSRREFMCYLLVHKVPGGNSGPRVKQSTTGRFDPTTHHTLSHFLLMFAIQNIWWKMNLK
jgi:hypothetical protein